LGIDWLLAAITNTNSVNRNINLLIILKNTYKYGSHALQNVKTALKLAFG
jgi:hypothetical protein